MPKIVGRDDSAVKRVTCRKCASILEYTESEVQDRRYSAMGDVGTVYFVQCPNGHEAIIRST